MSINLCPKYQVKEIAAICQCSERNVYQRWNLFNKEGLFSLIDKPRSGRPSLLKEEKWEELLEIFKNKSPCEMGKYLQQNWTLKTVEHYLKETYNIKVAQRTLSYWFHKSGWSYHRSQKGLLPPGPLKEETRQEVLRLLRQPNLSKEVVLFQDESAFYLCGLLGGCWFPKGEQREIVVHKKQKLWIFGSFNPHNKKFYYRRADKCNGPNFIKYLAQLGQQFKGKKINLVLDNAKFHISGLVKDYLEKHNEFNLLFLPPRGCKLNPIERFWLFVKKFLSNSIFLDIENLYSCLRKFFWRYQEGRIPYYFNLNKLVRLWQRWSEENESLSTN